MKILHGHVGTEVRVHVDDANAIPQKPPREDGEAYDSYGDSTFSIDPDGTLYIYGDRSKPAHHSYGRTPGSGWVMRWTTAHSTPRTVR